MPIAQTTEARNIGDVVRSKILDHQLSTGVFLKIGVFGLVGEEWVRDLSPNEVYEVKNNVKVAKEMIGEFRRQNVEFIIALTHQEDVGYT